MKIIIAEDDPVSQKVLRVFLERMGHEVTATSDGVEAWAALLASNARVVVSDWMMPNLDGLAFCRKVRGRAAKEYVYFIMLTARTGADNYHQAMDAGVDDFLTKPLNQEELTIRLRVAARILGFMDQIRELKRLLPICMYCKNVRDDKDYWHQIEVYIHDHTGTDFSHSICPKCYESQIKPQLDALTGEDT